MDLLPCLVLLIHFIAVVYIYDRQVIITFFFQRVVCVQFLLIVAAVINQMMTKSATIVDFLKV